MQDTGKREGNAGDVGEKRKPGQYACAEYTNQSSQKAGYGIFRSFDPSYGDAMI